MHRCSVDSLTLGVCRTFVAFCNKMWSAYVAAMHKSRSTRNADAPSRADPSAAAAFRPVLQLSMRQIWTALFGTW
jgi:hypothetical protein